MIDFTKRVRVTKTRSNDERSQANHEEGYWVEGVIAFGQRPQKGGLLLVERQIRNGVKVLGHFTTSMIKETALCQVGTVNGEEHSYMLITTNNSTYKLEQADESTD